LLTERRKCLSLAAWAILATNPTSAQPRPVPQAPDAVAGSGDQRADLTPAQVDKLIDTLFRGYLKTRDCGQGPTREGYLLTPHYVTADFNSDGLPDLAVAVWQCVDSSRDVEGTLPFRLFNLGEVSPPKLPPERSELSLLLRCRELLVILHGQTGRAFQDTPQQGRFALAAAIRGGDKELAVFRGRLKPAKLGDEPKPIPPPRGEVTAVVPNWKGEGMAVYWNGANYSYYPWYSCLYPKPKAPSKRPQ